MTVHVDVDVSVGATVIVAVHLNGNATLGVIGPALTIRDRPRFDDQG